MTKEFLKENAIPYTDYNVAEDMEKRQEMIEKSGQMGVPVIFVGDPSNPSGQAEMMVGFDKDKLSASLGL
jgi:glutaredoxin